MTELIKRLLGLIVSRATPLKYEDVRLLMELGDEAWRACQRCGLLCKYGGDGYHRDAPVCIPAQWDDDAWLYHARTCGHCPVFKREHEKK